MRLRIYSQMVAACLLLGTSVGTRALEHVTLRNGFELDCERREVVGERVRLYLMREAAVRGSANYVEVAADAVLRVESLPDAVGSAPLAGKRTASSKSSGGNDGEVSSAGKSEAVKPEPTSGEIHEMLVFAGGQHRVDADLLASVVRAESGGQTRAVSRTGARGLMQLMPGTASELGVKDAFVPAQNIDGGSAYLDHLLTRYHDDMALALAAYNAGPAAVDRYHGVPPYRETRAYVARVIREFNRRKLAEMALGR